MSKWKESTATNQGPNFGIYINFIFSQKKYLINVYVLRDFKHDNFIPRNNKK